MSPRKVALNDLTHHPSIPHPEVDQKQVAPRRRIRMRLQPTCRPLTALPFWVGVVERRIGSLVTVPAIESLHMHAPQPREVRWHVVTEASSAAGAACAL